ncbi:TPA: phage tail protein [Kluyvera intermedia]|uniref:Tail protein n=2 Tax=Enterobacteriaceae TaxID=543 RepID=A0AAC8QRJ8_9ENTR|nr:hypothetical protein [Phytobacter ursingii]HAT2207100.1 phage tail protein [Kluyvera intermedia]AKL13272.1 tail protein [Phytobacter ursingii]HAT2517792.1 phage tail protein [Kluyvera intermedia]HAT2605927.1 phage tail protein [Kluyvera intermedia]HAT2682769.1 phage tail protein [Kluyvera intermedia]
MSLNEPVRVSAVTLSASSLPDGLSAAYQQYILSQSLDFTNVAGKANEAGQGAYDAQVKNEEQDVRLGDIDTELADHESRITANEVELAGHETRITAAETTLTDHENRITTAEGNITSLSVRMTTAENKITTIQGDYVSKSVTTLQSMASPVSVQSYYAINGTQVVGPRASGWTAATGTALLGAFNSSATYSVSATYTQAEITAIATGLVQARQRIKALEDMLRTHGLMN